ncbi:entericidin A/B family lipoprotein [Betaproteobacteria bacterium SCN1]|jgi:predicted small secreted protein|nr:entericidin A/B family lipoprotein [Betaproteobacteria bacterium SCN1]MBN8761235.1 entericidin A/B family lipoprotein [Thiobacillus sp.]ODU88464.1 MAG: entericidin EcnAB [Thiobacillus sp. SCN 65-179]OJW36452.1 MAG: entericidin EcnAB [Thiobacillus sp. 65-69]
MLKPVIAAMIAAVLTLAGCNTVQGMGQDIQKAGGAIERAGSK